MHICVVKLTIIGSDNGLSPGRRQAIIWTNAGILLIGTLGTNFIEILIGIQTFSFKKMHLKMSSAKWRPSCLRLNVLIYIQCGAVISWSIFSQIFTKDIPYLTCKGEVWSVFWVSSIWMIFCLSSCNYLCNIWQYKDCIITALDCISHISQGPMSWYGQDRCWNLQLWADTSGLNFITYQQETSCIHKWELSDYPVGVCPVGVSSVSTPSSSSNRYLSNSRPNFSTLRRSHAVSSASISNLETRIWMVNWCGYSSNSETQICNFKLYIYTVEPFWKGQESLTKVAKFCPFPCTILYKSCSFYP